MLYIHPFIQIVAILIALYVWYLGFKRFKSAHLKIKSPFNWKNHVKFGKIALVIWFLGIIGGLTIAKIYWKGFFVTKTHGRVGVLILPFIFFALISGYFLDKKKKKRKILPLIHGIINTIMLLLALSQIFTGIEIIKLYILDL